ncbi:MAG TPA: peptidylprolyl isomerase, partial [Prevotella sp.]
MKSKMLFATMLFFVSMAQAQVDPIIMTINGQPVTRSEFEYSYNKNNAEGVIDKKSVDEYVDLFINYKLKVVAAEAAHLDTLSSFKQEFATYRDQQIRPAIIGDADVEAEAKRLYEQARSRVDGMGGLVKPSHILIAIPQKASKVEERAAKLRADSIYSVLKRGEDFATLAKTYSKDPGSARNGGELPWIEKGQTLKEFDEKIFSMKKGEMSEPFLTAAGYHIVLLKDRRNFFPYDSLRAEILQFIDQRGLREEIINHKLDTLAKAAGNGTTPDDVL